MEHLQVEYYGSPWKNEGSRAVPKRGFEPREVSKDVYRGFNIIDNPDSVSAGEKGKTDNFKWAVFAQKTVKNRLTLGLRVGSDHFSAPSSAKSGYEGIERLHAPDEWYVHFSLRTNF